jgi:outer membrane protein OmpA-like peptidoglycan-associated protein
VNTEKDDFAFSFNTDKNLGYVSSNRSGKDHIYSASPICYAQIFVAVKNAKTGELVANSKVVILDATKTILETKMSDRNGEVLYDVECQKTYTIKVFKDGYVSKSFPIVKISEGKVTVDAVIDPVELIVTETEIILNPIYFEYNKSSITLKGAAELDKLVYVMSQNDTLNIYVKSHTDSRGTDAFNLDLSERRANATVAYIVSKGISIDKITGKGFGESEFKVNCQENCTEEEHALNRRSEFMIVK